MKKHLFFALMLLAACFVHGQLPSVCFQTVATSPTEHSFQSRVCTADFNSDGKADLAVANTNTWVNGPANSISVYMGAGTGTFAAGVDYNAGSNPRGICSADFNGDGKPDLATANNGSSSVAVSVLLNNGNGTFNTVVNYSLSNAPAIDIVSADFNGDGKADLAVILNNTYMNYKFYILLNTGTGSFSAPVLNSGVVPGSPFSVITSDFNGDGKADLAIASSSGNDNVSIYLGTGTGSFSTPTYYSSISANSYFLTAADFNGDGKPDIATSGSSHASVFMNAGAGTFSPAVSYGSILTAFGIKAADYNSDGKTDLAISNNSTNNGLITVLLGSGTGSFNVQADFIGMPGGNYDLVSADFNGDTKPDLAMTPSGASSNVLPNISIALNSIAPTITVAATSTVLCTGHSATLTASGPVNYTWSPSTFNASIAVSPATTTNYTVSGKFAGGCTNTAVYNMVVSPNPTITVSDGTICAGQNFSISPGGAATYTISGGSAVVSPVVSTTYSVTGSSAAGCPGVNSAVANVIVNPLPVVVAAGSYSIICIGTTATLIADGATSYVWSTGVNTSSFVISPTVTTTYSVTGTDNNGCSKTATVTILTTDCNDPWPVGFVTQVKEERIFTLYPNPNAGSFTIESTTETLISITTILGKEIIKQRLAPGKNNADLSEQPTGIYFINGGGTRLKVVKQ